MLTLPLPTRPLIVFRVVYCSVTLRCSDFLTCAESLGARFLWDTL